MGVSNLGNDRLLQNRATQQWRPGLRDDAQLAVCRDGLGLWKVRVQLDLVDHRVLAGGGVDGLQVLG